MHVKRELDLAEERVGALTQTLGTYQQDMMNVQGDVDWHTQEFDDKRSAQPTEIERSYDADWNKPKPSVQDNVTEWLKAIADKAAALEEQAGKGKGSSVPSGVPVLTSTNPAKVPKLNLQFISSRENTEIPDVPHGPGGVKPGGDPPSDPSDSSSSDSESKKTTIRTNNNNKRKKSSSSSSSSDEGTSAAATASLAMDVVLKGNREADKLPSVFWPAAGTVDEFQIQVAKTLATASLYCDQREVAWVNEVVQDGKNIEDFADSGEPRFHSLDLKLMYMLTNSISHNSARLHQRVKTK